MLSHYKYISSFFFLLLFFNTNIFTSTKVNNVYFCHLCSIKFTYSDFVKNHHVAQCLKQRARWKLRFYLSMWLETGHVCNILNVEKKIIHRCLCAMEPIFNSVLHLECQDIKDYNYCMFYHLRRRSHGRSKNVKETNITLHTFFFIYFIFFAW